MKKVAGKIHIHKYTNIDTQIKIHKYTNREIQKGGGNNGEMEEGTWGRTITLINAMESYTMGETVMTQIQRILQIQILSKIQIHYEKYKYKKYQKYKCKD